MPSSDCNQCVITNLYFSGSAAQICLKSGSTFKDLGSIQTPLKMNNDVISMKLTSKLNITSLQIHSNV